MSASTMVRFVFYAITACVLLTMFFFQLGGYALSDNNEGLYAQIPLEMLGSGDWVIPTLNGNPYIEKPPLLYWLMAILYSWFPTGEGVSRFIPALAGFLVCLSTGGFLMHLTRYKEAPWLCPLILGTSVAMVIFSRMIFFDGVLTFFFTGALLSFFIWYVKNHKKWLYGFYALLALAVMTKGFLSLVLAIGIMGGFFLLDLTSWQKIRGFFSPGPLGVFLCMTVPWHVLASIQEPGFPWFYFVNEHVLRFLDLREPRDYYHGPFYYYIPRLVGGLMPWSFLSILLVRFPSVRSMPKLNKFLWVWFLGILIFFSCSQAKANYYMMMAFPPCALLLSMVLEDCLHQKTLWIRSLSSLTLLMLTMIFWALFSFDWDILGQTLKLKTSLAPYKHLIPVSFIVGWSVFLVCALIGIWGIPRLPALSLLLLGMGMVPILYRGAHIMKHLEPLYSTKPLLKTLIEQDPKAFEHLYLYKEYEKLSSSLYYVGKPLPLINSHSADLAYGQKHPRNPALFLTDQDFNEKLDSGAPVYLLTRAQYIQELKPKGFFVKIQQGDKVLLEKKP